MQNIITLKLVAFCTVLIRFLIYFDLLMTHAVCWQEGNVNVNDKNVHSRRIVD